MTTATVTKRECCSARDSLHPGLLFLPPRHPWMIVVSVICYALILTGIVLEYVFFAPRFSCTLNILFVTLTLMIVVVLTAISVHPKASCWSLLVPSWRYPICTPPGALHGISPPVVALPQRVLALHRASQLHTQSATEWHVRLGLTPPHCAENLHSRALLLMNRCIA